MAVVGGLAIAIAAGLGLGVAVAPAVLDRLDQLLLGLGDVRRPVGREVLAERLDVAGLVLAGQELELVEHAVRQRLELLGHLGVAVVRRLVVAEPADPDLEPGVLLELAQRAESVQPGVDLVGQELELAAGEVGLGVPEQPVLGGELLGQLGLEPVDLAAELAVLVGRHPELAPRLLDLAGHLLQVEPRLPPRPLDLRLATPRSTARRRSPRPATT